MREPDGDVRIRELDRPGDLGWVVMAHGELYAAEFGWDTSFEGLVARIAADYAAEPDHARNAAWIAELDGERVRLWTNHPLAPARRTYLRHGFSLVAEEPHHSFGVDLIGQTYELDLRAGPASARRPSSATARP